MSKRLTLAMLHTTSSKATEAVKAVASAIQWHRNLQDLTLGMENGFTDEAGVALAEALTVNKTLRKITLTAEPLFAYESLPKDELGAPTYEAFGAMLRRNTILNLELPPFHYTGDDRLLDSRAQMTIEQRLNQVGLGRLLASSNHATREDWVDALYELSTLMSATLLVSVACTACSD